MLRIEKLPEYSEPSIRQPPAPRFDIRGRAIELMKSPLLRTCLVLALGIHSSLAQQQVSPRPNPARLIEAITAFAKQDAETGGIVFTGSSSIRRWPQLKESFPGLPVVNLGFGGSIANDLIVFFETIITRHEPKLVVIYTGGNDLNEKLSVEESVADYTKFLNMIHDRFPDTRVIITSVKIAQRRVLQIPSVHALNQQLEAWCSGKDWVRFVDCTTYLADSDGQPISSFYIEDHLHLSPEGYAKWTGILEPVLREEWEKVN